MNRFCFHPLRLCALLIGLLMPVLAAAEPVADYRLKAAVVYNLALFTTWPPEASAGQTFNVCFLNAPELKQGMQELNLRSLHGRPIVLNTSLPTDKLGDCHLLILGAVGRDRLGTIRRKIADAPVLTISDEPGLQDNVMIAMATERDRVVFDMDQSAARSARLTLSSKLLRLARSVR